MCKLDYFSVCYSRMHSSCSLRLCYGWSWDALAFSAEVRRRQICCMRCSKGRGIKSSLLVLLNIQNDPRIPTHNTELSHFWRSSQRCSEEASWDWWFRGAARVWGSLSSTRGHSLLCLSLLFLPSLSIGLCRKEIGVNWLADVMVRFRGGVM